MTSSTDNNNNKDSGSISSNSSNSSNMNPTKDGRWKHQATTTTAITNNKDCKIQDADDDEEEEVDKVHTNYYLHIGPSYGDYWIGDSIFAAKHLQPDYVKSIKLSNNIDVDRLLQVLDEEQEKQEKQEDEIDTTAEENDGFKPTPTTSSRDIYDTGIIPKYILEKSYRQSKTNTNNNNNDNSNNSEQ